MKKVFLLLMVVFITSAFTSSDSSNTISKQEVFISSCTDQYNASMSLADDIYFQILVDFAGVPGSSGYAEWVWEGLYQEAVAAKFDCEVFTQLKKMQELTP